MAAFTAAFLVLCPPRIRASSTAASSKPRFVAILPLQTIHTSLHTKYYTSIHTLHRSTPETLSRLEPGKEIRMSTLKAVRGTRDLLPPETELWNRIESTARAVFGRYNFGEI